MDKNLSRFKQVTIKFVKYGLVGCSGMLVDFSATYTFIELANFNIFAASAVGFVLATLSNYVLNSIWTFSNIRIERVNGLLKFLLFSTIALFLNFLFVSLFMQYGGVGFYLSKFFAIGIVFVWNFSVNYLFTFRQNQRFSPKTSNKYASVDAGADSPVAIS